MTVVRDNDIELASGLYLDVANPEPEQVTLHDVASGLSKMCRYGGQCSRFFSVAEHTLLVADRLRRDGYDACWQLAGLHHDDHEGLGLCDVPRPTKRLLSDYPPLAIAVQGAAMSALNLPLLARDVEHPIVKAADNWALMQEAGELLPSGGANWVGFGNRWDGLWRNLGLDPDDAYEAWIAHHDALMRVVG